MDSKLLVTLACLLAGLADVDCGETEETTKDEKHFSFGGLCSESKETETDNLYPYSPIEFLVKERDELRKKYAAINKFINCIANPDTISYSEMKILERQREIIGDYIDILDTRLKRIGVDNG